MSDLDEFKTEILETLDREEKALLEFDHLPEGTSSVALYDEIFRAYHNIKGAAGMLEWQEKLSSVDELQRLMQGSAPVELKQKFIDMSTNNETLFFRDASFYAALERYLVDVILPTNPKEIKIWSAASSSGQEALSVAMTIDELSKEMAVPPFSILATDICEKALKKAKSGLYSDFELGRGLSDERRNRYFVRTDAGQQARDEILSKIHYGFNNLTRSTVTEKFHLILCRNVLIYQRVEVKKVVIESLYERLEQNGGLMLGVGETMFGVTDSFDHQFIGNYGIFRLKNSKILNAG